MHRAFCSFNDSEYEALEKRAHALGMSTSKLIEYAVLIYLDLPRTEMPNLSEIQARIESYLSNLNDGDSFICSSPFGSDWAKMTTSAKRTAASQIRLLVDKGLLEKIPPATKSHQATIYKKVKK